MASAMDMMGADSESINTRLVWDWIERSRIKSFSVRDAFNQLCATFQRSELV